MSLAPPPLTFNDSVAFQDSCDASHGFHFAVFVPSNVTVLQAAKLSLFLRAFRSDVSGVSASGSTSFLGSASSFTTQTELTNLNPQVLGFVINSISTAVCATGCNGTCHHGTFGSIGSVVENGINQTTGSFLTNFVPSNPSSVTSASVSYGVVESTTAAGVTVVINGVDRTAALGGPFSADQVELNVLPYLTVGAWNTIDLTPTGLGRILAHCRLTGLALTL